MMMEANNVTNPSDNELDQIAKLTQLSFDVVKSVFKKVYAKNVGAQEEKSCKSKNVMSEL